MLKKAFSIFQEIPFLQYIIGSEYDLLVRRIPAEKLQGHLVSDRVFIPELFTRLQEAGILIQVQPEKIFGLLYPLVLSIFPEDELLLLGGYRINLDLSLELVAAYCLGEIEIQLQSEEGTVP